MANRQTADRNQNQDRARATVFGALVSIMVLGLAGSAPWGEARASEHSAAQTHLRFSAYWGGLHAADFALSYWSASTEFSDTNNYPSKRRHTFRLETQGLIGFLAKMRLDAVSEGTPRADGQWHDDRPFVTDLYRVDYASRRRERTVEVTYDRDGNRASPRIQTRNEPPQKDRRNEAKVPPRHRIGTVDPLVALIGSIEAVRHHVNANGPKIFTLPVYDGRRRFDIAGAYLGVITRRIRDHTVRVHKMRLTPRPIAGFKDSHIELWNTYAFDLYVSTDGRFLPLQIDAIGPGPIIHLIEECDGPCALPPS